MTASPWGKFIGANASDLPRIAQSAQLHKVELGYAGVECHYSLDELRTTSAQNMPIDLGMQSELRTRGRKNIPSASRTSATPLAAWLVCSTTPT